MTPQKARDLIVRAWRKPRTTPRPDDPTCFEDNAPDWVWKLAAQVTECTTLEVDGGFGLLGELVAWCAEGEAETRSTQIQTLIEAWVGPRVPMLRAFLDAARKTGAGRQAVDPATGMRPNLRPRGKGEPSEVERKLDRLVKAGLVSSIDDPKPTKHFAIDADPIVGAGVDLKSSEAGPALPRQLESYAFFGADWKPFTVGGRITYFYTDNPIVAASHILAGRSDRDGVGVLALPAAFPDSEKQREIVVGGQRCSIVSPRVAGVALHIDTLLFHVDALKTAADLSWFRVVARGVHPYGSIIAILPNKT